MCPVENLFMFFAPISGSYYLVLSTLDITNPANA